MQIMRTIPFLLALLSYLSPVNATPVQEFALDNGLKIRVKEDHRAPVVVSMIWYNVGSADEPGGITGVSHVLEHLMFKGTEKYPAGVFSKTMARIGGQENAFTSYDYTAYYEQTSAAHLAISLKLEADRMRHLQLDPTEFTHELKVIQEERRMRTDNNPQALTLERFLSSAHLASPYHHPVIGWMSDLEHMQMEDARQWYARFYAPNNATLVVVGDVDAKHVYTLAKHYFANLTPAPQLVRKSQQEPPILGKKTVEVNRPAQVPMLLLGYTVPSIQTTPPNETTITPYALELIAALLSASDNGRFDKQLVHAKHIANSAQAYYNPYARYQTQFMMMAVPNQRHSIADLQAAILSEIDRLKQTLVSPNELDRIKMQLIAQKTFDHDSLFNVAMEIGLLETLGLGWKTADQYVTRIQAITPEEVQTTAKRYFNANNLTKAQLIPKREKTRTEEPKQRTNTQ